MELQPHTFTQAAICGPVSINDMFKRHNLFFLFCFFVLFIFILHYCGGIKRSNKRCNPGQKKKKKKIFFSGINERSFVELYVSAVLQFS